MHYLQSSRLVKQPLPPSIYKPSTHHEVCCFLCSSCCAKQYLFHPSSLSILFCCFVLCCFCHSSCWIVAVKCLLPDGLKAARALHGYATTQVVTSSAPDDPAGDQFRRGALDRGRRCSGQLQHGSSCRSFHFWIWGLIGPCKPTDDEQTSIAVGLLT